MRYTLGDENYTVRSPDWPLQHRYHLDFMVRGGMSCAYRAAVGELTCFVKEVPLEQSDHLRAEARILQRLPPGDFPRFVEIFEEEGYVYLVTEFMEGLTLQQEVQRNPWIYPDDAELRKLARELCGLLEVLHALDPPILHLDIKPGNLIRSPDGRIHLLDFGISRLFLPPLSAKVGHGSPQTASPEHFTGQLDQRSDLFSLAATVHFMATRGQASRVPHGPFPLVRDYNRAVSESLDEWLQICLSLASQRRPAQVTAARHLLDETT